MKKLFLAIAITGAALAALAPASAQPREQCLRSSQIDSFASIRGDQRSMVVIDRFRNKYKVSFNTVCDSIDYNGSLAIRSMSNSRLACIRRGDIVTTRGVGGWNERCVVTGVQPYTPAMERADRDRANYRR